MATYGTVDRQFDYYKDGTIAVATAVGPKWTYRGNAASIVRADATVDTAPTTQAIICDINKNGTTIWTTQANRVQIAASATSGTQTTFDVTAVADGDVFSLDIDQVGSGTAGADLTVTLQVRLN